MKTNLAVKEWAGVISAMAKGTQFILIRKYQPVSKQFLLYPTYSYFSAIQKTPDQLREKFQPAYLDLARKSAEEQLKTQDIVNLKYWFQLDETFEDVRAEQISNLEPFMIWSVDHVIAYAKRGPLHVWLGRTFQLETPVKAARQVGGGSLMVYRHFEEIELHPSVAVVSEERFQEHKKSICKIVAAQKK